MLAGLKKKIKELNSMAVGQVQLHEIESDNHLSMDAGISPP